jgi:hypothetical protein
MISLVGMGGSFVMFMFSTGSGICLMWAGDDMFLVHMTGISCGSKSGS